MSEAEARDERGEYGVWFIEWTGQGKVYLTRLHPDPALSQRIELEQPVFVDYILRLIADAEA